MLDVLIVWVVWVRIAPRGIGDAAPVRRSRRYTDARDQPSAGATLGAPAPGPRTTTVTAFALRTLGWLPMRSPSGTSRRRSCCIRPCCSSACSLGSRCQSSCSSRAFVDGRDFRDRAQARHGGAASAVLTVDVNLLLYSFGLPLSRPCRSRRASRHGSGIWQSVMPCCCRASPGACLPIS